MPSWFSRPSPGFNFFRGLVPTWHMWGAHFLNCLSPQLECKLCKEILLSPFLPRSLLGSVCCLSWGGKGSICWKEGNTRNAGKLPHLLLSKDMSDKCHKNTSVFQICTYTIKTKNLLIGFSLEAEQLRLFASSPLQFLQWEHEGVLWRPFSPSVIHLGLFPCMRS